MSLNLPSSKIDARTWKSCATLSAAVLPSPARIITDRAGTHHLRAPFFFYANWDIMRTRSSHRLSNAKQAFISQKQEGRRLCITFVLHLSAGLITLRHNRGKSFPGKSANFDVSDRTDFSVIHPHKKSKKSIQSYPYRNFAIIRSCATRIAA